MRAFRLPTLAVLALLAFGALAARAEPGDDPIARLLYPPETLLGHAQELGLDDAQRKAVRTEVVQAQKQFLDAQLDLQEETETLARLLQERPINEAKALAAADRVMGFERTVKKTHLALLIRLKNLLTPAQLAKMAEIQKRGEP
jgi:Spy/CpxP family protein refolding chaperone